MARYRNKIKIVADILEISERGARKTHIIYRGNLSFKLATIYLEAILKAGLIVFNRKSGYYLLTGKGRAFLERFNDYSKHAKSLEKQHARVKSELSFLEHLCFGMPVTEDKVPAREK